MVAITKPLSYRKVHIKLRHTSVVIIWMISLIFCSLPVFPLYYQKETIYNASREFILHGFHTIPLILIVIMYGKMAWTVFEQNDLCSTYGKSEVTNKQSFGITKTVVLCLLVCYLPYLSMWEYTYSVMSKRKPCVVSNFEVSCINYRIINF